MSVYQNLPRKRSLTDKAVIGIVGLIAMVIISLSFKHTSEIAQILALPPLGTAFLVEVLFGSLLFLRARQRALQLNVPLFLHLGYFAAFTLVTATNIYGLSVKNIILGPVFGLSISGSMWLMENVLVWLWTSAHQPYEKSIRQRMQEAKREIREEKAIQQIEWMKWEARKPDLQLIRKARAADEKRKEVVGDGLPEFFCQEKEPIKEMVAELKDSESKIMVQKEPEPKQEAERAAEVIPIKRQIGFHIEPSKPKPGSSPLFQPNLEARAKAIQTAKQLKEQLGRLPKKRELIEKGFTDHYARMALSELKNR